MENNKSRHTLWLTDKIWAEVDENYRRDNCNTYNEFVERALTFYIGYLHAKKASDYLPEILGTVLQGSLDNFCDRIGRILFKQAVEMNVCNHILTIESDINNDAYQKLRGVSVREIKETNGHITFGDVIRSERSLM